MFGRQQQLNHPFKICAKLLHKHDKLTQCCRAFTLALARLSCSIRSCISEGAGEQSFFQVQEVLPLKVIDVISGAVIQLQTQFTGTVSEGANKLNVYTLKTLLMEGAVIPKAANYLKVLHLIFTAQEGALHPNCTDTCILKAVL